VQLSRCEADAVISVTDDGPGIPIDEHQHVFRRFYRLDRSRCTPGNGLGLSLVAAVARLHDARIKLSRSRLAAIWSKPRAAMSMSRSSGNRISKKR
jgi:signal transduction histidine kinase